ncbi:SLC13 family permease [Ruegeria marina]|uniref:SLC13 family permease n=1 Tax=Ruegeria marina TaxID=639004 RepID=UPI00115FDE49|nr:SLC13 family permease [Ruegeria marina]
MATSALIAAMSSFGLAMEESGAASYLARHIVSLTKPFDPVVAMAGFILLTILLTQQMSNAAAALTVIPVASAAASGLTRGCSPSSSRSRPRCHSSRLWSPPASWSMTPGGTRFWTRSERERR